MPKAVARESPDTMVVEATIKILAATTGTTVMTASRDQGSEETGTKEEATTEIDRKVATQSHLTAEAIKIEAIDKVATVKEAMEVAVDSQRSQTHLS